MNLPKAQAWLTTLSGTQAQGIMGEMRYAESLVARGEQIQRVADMISGQQAADIIIQGGRVIDVKTYDFSASLYRQHWYLEIEADYFVTQANQRRTQYPGRAVEFVFLNTTLVYH